MENEEKMSDKELNALKTKLDQKKDSLNKQEANFTKHKLERFNFSGMSLNNISFEGATLENCNFENAILTECDFRHSKIDTAIFTKAKLYQCDFYQTAFKGINIFQDAEFYLCSLSYVSFDAYCITGNNLKETDGKILIQEDKEKYKNFLHKAIGNEAALNSRYREAGRIYRQFTAMWGGKGNNKDENWAYIQAKKMERLQLKYEEPHTVKNILTLWGINIFAAVFGYGIKLRNVLFAFLAVIIASTILYGVLGKGFPECLSMGLGFIAGIGERSELKGEASYYISALETGIGMFLTGIFAFIVTNKIRKS